MQEPIHITLYCMGSHSLHTTEYLAIPLPSYPCPHPNCKVFVNTETWQIRILWRRVQLLTYISDCLYLFYLNVMLTISPSSWRLTDCLLYQAIDRYWFDGFERKDEISSSHCRQLCRPGSGSPISSRQGEKSRHRLCWSHQWSVLIRSSGSGYSELISNPIETISESLCSTSTCISTRTTTRDQCSIIKCILTSTFLTSTSIIWIKSVTKCGEPLFWRRRRRGRNRTVEQLIWRRFLSTTTTFSLHE